MRVCEDGMKDAEYTGYYERVKDGEGTFVQKIVKGEDGNESLSFVRQDHGNIIWHTVNDFEKSDYKDQTFDEKTDRELTNEGDRIYTKRKSTGDKSKDNINVTENYYLYKNNDYFLKDSIGCKTQEEADNYSVIIKTITPEELNARPEWADYADLYVISPRHSGGADMPNAQRKKEQLRIYQDVARQNEILVSYLAKRQNATATSTLLNATDNRTLHNGRHCPQCHLAVWQESRLAVREGGIGRQTANGQHTTTEDRKQRGPEDRAMANGDILSDFGINLLEEEIDDVIFQTNEFLTDATFTGAQGPFWWILQMCMALAALFSIVMAAGIAYKRRQARAVGRHEAVEAACRVDYHLLVVSACGHGYGGEPEQLVFFLNSLSDIPICIWVVHP